MKIFASFITVTSLALLGTGSVFAQQAPTQAPRDGAYDEVTVADKGIIPYNYIREADVYWKKRIWRVIDVREKMNLPFKYEKQPLITILRDAALEGTLAVYDDEDFKKRRTNDEVKTLGVGTSDTVNVPNMDGTDSMVVTNPQFDPTKINRFRVKEDWIFDKQTSTMVVRIIGIAPILTVTNADGSERPPQVLFWVYYPEARPLLAKYTVFNPKNDAMKASWEDLFESRYFASFIMKESNVYDRRVQDYATGVDAMYESDKIKNDIFEWEHDLWQF